MVFRIKLQAAIKASITIGIGFIGIFMVFDYFVSAISPAIKALISHTGLHFNVLDVGWTPLAAITWSFKLAPLLILLVMVVNVILLLLKLTKTVNIDIWNYWHFIFIGSLVYGTTNNIILALISALVASVITIKIADWSAPRVKELSGMDGICLPTLSAIAYYPLGIVGDKLLDKIPGINKLNANPETLKRKLGLLGEPSVIGFLMGILLGIGSRYELKNILELAFQIAAVVYILPQMCGIVGTALLPISEGMKNFINKHFPNMGQTYIGLDEAVIVGNPAIVVTGILLMPVALLLAFVLPGITFMPLGDLPNIMGAVALVVVATRGNVVRSFIIGIPILICKLYVASNMASLYTTMAHKANFTMANYKGSITSFLDGGNLMRFWLYKLFTGNIYALIFIPIVALLLYITWKSNKKDINITNNK